MKTLKDLLLLGDPRLYEVCDPIKQLELPLVKQWVADLDNVMQEVRASITSAGLLQRRSWAS